MRITRMKTLMLFERFGWGDTQFLELEGDFHHLDGVFINALPPKNFKGGKRKYEKLCEELYALLYTEDHGERSLPWRSSPTKDWDVFIRCRFVP
jgi:hypothetical protein